MKYAVVRALNVPIFCQITNPLIVICYTQWSSHVCVWKSLRKTYCSKNAVFSCVGDVLEYHKLQHFSHEAVEKTCKSIRHRPKLKDELKEELWNLKILTRTCWTHEQELNNNRAFSGIALNALYTSLTRKTETDQKKNVLWLKWLIFHIEFIIKQEFPDLHHWSTFWILHTFYC